MERAREFLEVPLSLLREICRPFFGSRAENLTSELLTRGAMNTSYRLILDEDLFVLRFYVRDRLLCGIDSAIHRLIGEKIPIPDLLYADPEAVPYPFAIFRSVQGIHLNEIQDPQEACRLSYQLGEVLAKIHSFAFPQAGLFGKDLCLRQLFEESSSPYYEYIVQTFGKESLAWKRLGNSASEKLLERIHAHKELFPVIHGGGVLVHSDFIPK